MGRFDQFMDDAPEAPAANLNLRFGVEASPDEAAESTKLARRYKLPVGVVSEFRGEYKQQAQLDDAKAVVDKSPKLKSWLAFDDNNAKMAHDDVETLGGIEGILGTLGSGARYATNTGEGRGLLTDVAKAARSVAAGVPSFNAGIWGAAAYPFEAVGLDSVGQSLRGLQREQQRVADHVANVDPNAGIVERGIMSGMRSFGQNAITLPLGFANTARVTGEQAMLAAMGLITFGQSYGKARDQGASVGTAGFYGMEDATAEVFTEKFFGAAKLLGDAKAGMGMARLFMRDIAREIPGEMGATVWQNFNEWATLNPEKTVKEWLSEQPEALAETVVATIAGAGAQVGAIRATQKIMGDGEQSKAQAQQAEQHASAIERLSKLFAASKLNTRDAPTFRDLVAQIADEEGDAPTEFYIDPSALANSLNQSGMTMVELEALAPKVAQQLQTPTGADIRVPVSEFMAAGEEFTAPLIDHLRTSEGAMTRGEAREYLKTEGDIIRADVESELAKRDDQATFRQSIESVRTQFETELNAAKRFTPAVNKAYSELLANFYGATASRLGMTPEALLDKYKLRVQANNVAGERTLTQGGKLPKMLLYHGGKKVLDSLDGKGVQNRFLYATPLDKMARQYGENVTALAVSADAVVIDLADPEALLGSAQAMAAVSAYAEENGIDNQALQESLVNGRVWEEFSQVIQDDLADYIGAAIGADVIALPDSTFSSTPDVQGKSFVILNKGMVSLAAPGKRATNKAAVDFTVESTGSHSGQTDYTLTLREGGREVGAVDYSVYGGSPAIQMVRVPEGERRKGYGRRLVQRLQAEFPDTEIQWGALTNEGAALKASLKFREVPAPDAQEKQAKLQAAIAERAALESKAAEAGGDLTGVDIDGWNELHDLISALEADVGGQPTAARLIESGTLNQSANILNQSATPEQAALAALAQSDEIFSLPKSDKDTIEGIAADIDPEIKVKADLAEGLDRYILTMPDGTEAYIFVRTPSPYGPQSYGSRVDGGEVGKAETVRPGEDALDMRNVDDVWINVSRLKSGGGGASVYAIASDFAHNAGKVFIGDPAGVSDAAMRRRPEQMLSSALRWGTTEHLAPHPRQVAGAPELGIPPLKWVAGDDLANIRSLIEVNIQALENAGYDDSLISFDTSTGSFRDSGGQELSRADIASLSKATNLGSSGVAGGKTLARGAVLRALLREESAGVPGADGQRDGLLARIAKLASDSPEATDRLFQGDEGVTPRAQIAFPADIAGSTSVISLLAGADLSSFIHETGHFFLEVQSDLASRIQQQIDSGASVSALERGIVDDMNRLLKWFGVTGREQASGPDSGSLNQNAIDKTQTKAFKKWFGDSKVVDAGGKPLVVYHGAVEGGIEKLDTKWTAFFTDDPTIASRYAADASGMTATGRSAEDATPHVQPVYLSLKNPLIIDANGSSYAAIPHDGRFVFMDNLAKEAKAKGHDGLIVKNVEDNPEGGYGDGPKTNVYAVFDAPGKVKSATGNRGTFDPNDENILNQGGEDIPAPEGPSPQGRTPLETWSMMSLNEKREFHEKFARGFERFAMEGNAPSIELQAVFSRFRSWLVQVYKTLRGLNVDLNDDVRAVMGRMLATDFAIEEAEAQRSMGPLFKDAESAGMTLDEYDAYQATARGATDQAVSELQARGMKDMKWLSRARDKALKARQQEVEELRREIRNEVRSEVMAEPVYQAWQFLSGKQQEVVPGAQAVDDIDTVQQSGKLRTQVLRDMYGTEEAAIWRELSARRMTSDATGMHPEIVAEMFGYDSADAMVKALVDAMPPQEVIDARTDQRMLEMFGDITSEEALQRAADEAVHNEARARFIATEMKALEAANKAKEKQGKGTVDVLARAAKDYAQQIIARLKVREIRPNQYATAEARSAKLAEKAFMSGKTEEAALHKRNQLVNNYATKAAYDAQEEVKSAQKYFRKFDKRSKSIDAGYQDQIEQMLERFDFRPASLKAIDQRNSLAQWYADQVAIGAEPSIPEDILNEANRKSFKDMTLEELRGLRETVEQVEHLGRLKNKLLLAKDRRDFEAIASEMAASIVEHGGKARPVRLEGPNKAVDWFAGVAAAHRKLASLFREMDGNKDTGPMYELIGRGMNERGTMEDVMVEKATVALRDIYAPIVKLKGGITGYRSKLFIPEINASLTRGGRLAVALNWGNEANRQRIMDGDKWSEGQVRAILKTLTKTELEFVNGVWAYVDTYWEDIAAKEKRLTGVEPEKVEASPFNVVSADGTEVAMRGGYYPLKYDTDRSDRADTQEAAQSAKEMMQGAFTRATTRRGHTKARVEEVKRAVRKDLNVLTQHITQVTHDLAWHEWLIDTNKLLADDGVVSAIRDHYGPQVLKTMRDDVMGIATADVAPQTAIDSALLRIRSNVTRATMGASLTTAFLQPFGLTQSMVRIGPKHVLRGVARWGGDAIRMENTLGWIQGKSEFMRLRSKTFNKELREIRGSVQGKSKTMRVVDAGLFALMQKMQLVADVPTWVGQYEKSIAEGLDEASAVAMADRSVLESQGGGQTKDLAEVQRKHPMLTQFYSYFSVTLNLAAEQTAATNFKNPAAVAGWLGDMALLMVIPAILPSFIMYALKGGDDDDEKLAKKLAEWQVGYLLGTVVGLRELSGAVGGFDYAGPPVGRIIGDLGKAGKQTAQGEIDDAAVLSYVNLLGSAFGIPTVQAIRSYKGWKAWDEGEEGAGAQSVLFGPPPKK